MRVSPLAYACFLLPCSVIALCYVLSMSLHPMPAGFPFYHGQVSISAVARQDPSIHIFRLVILPTTTLLIACWLICGSWLKTLGVPDSRSKAVTRLGVIGAAFLALYAVFLGTDGSVYEWLRRFGTTTYFGATGLAQLLAASALLKWEHTLQPATSPRIIRILTGLSVYMLILGLIYLPADLYFESSRVINVIEWHFAFLMHIYFGVLSIQWHRHRLRISLAVGSDTCAELQTEN